MTNLEHLREDMSKISYWCNGNEPTMNLDKTKYQIFPRNTHVDMNKLSENCIIKVWQTCLKKMKLYKYLGVEIDNFLTMNQHVRKMITMQAALMIFKSVFPGVLDYGSIFVSSLPEQTKEDIQILQNNALRSCLNIIDPRNLNILEMHADTNIQLFRHRMIRTLLLCIRTAV